MASWRLRVCAKLARRNPLSVNIAFECSQFAGLSEAAWDRFPPGGLWLGSLVVRACVSSCPVCLAPVASFGMIDVALIAVRRLDAALALIATVVRHAHVLATLVGSGFHSWWSRSSLRSTLPSDLQVHSSLIWTHIEASRPIKCVSSLTQLLSCLANACWNSAVVFLWLCPLLLLQLCTQRIDWRSYCDNVLLTQLLLQSRRVH